MKLVRETINFTRGSDPKDTLDLGIEWKIDNWLKEHDLHSQYEILWHVDGRIEIDYYGVIQFDHKTWPEKILPDYIRFRKAFGVDLQAPLKLKNENLEGFPREVFGKSTGYFLAPANKLTSFIRVPQIIEGSLILDYNPIGSLAGLPRKIGNHLFLSGTPLSKRNINHYEKIIKKECDIGGNIIWSDNMA